jgi:DNA-binding CsgD family transcriptional regulator
MAVSSPERLRERASDLLDSDQAVEELAHAAADLLSRTVDFDGFCLITTDPETMLPTGEFVENGLPDEVLEQMAAIEVRGEDFNAFDDLRRADRTTASLREATGGDLARSERHRELRAPHGFGDELRSGLIVDGAMWAGLTLLRSTDRPPFSPDESEAVGSVATSLALAVRHSLLAETVRSRTLPRVGPGAGLLLLAGDDSLTHADAAVEFWLSQLGGSAESVPQVIAAAVARARHEADRTAVQDSSARTRVRAPSGVWLTVRASLLRGDEPGRVGVILGPAGAADLAPLLADLYGISEREREVAQLVGDGASTAAIAEQLHLSPWTVQDHLKSLFEKLGVSSRGELVTRLFLHPAPPRLTD